MAICRMVFQVSFFIVVKVLKGYFYYSSLSSPELEPLPELLPSEVEPPEVLPPEVLPPLCEGVLPPLSPSASSAEAS